MTERQAWLKLAKAWEQAYVPDRRAFPVAYGMPWDGLCPCIDTMDGISSAIKSSMFRKIRRNPRDNNDTNYRWPLTMDGAKQRAAFCRLQVKKLTRKKGAAHAGR